MMQLFLENRGECGMFFTLRTPDYVRKLMLVFLNFVLFETDTVIREDVHRSEHSVDDFQRKAVWKLYKDVHGREMAMVRVNVDWIFQPSGKGFEYYPMLYRLVSAGIRSRVISSADGWDILARYSVLHTKKQPVDYSQPQKTPDETAGTIVMESASLVTVAVDVAKEGIDGIGVLPADHNSMHVIMHMFALFNLANMCISPATAAMHYADVVSTVNSAGGHCNMQHMTCPVVYHKKPLGTPERRDHFDHVIYDNELFFIPHAPQSSARSSLLSSVDPVVLALSLDRPFASTDAIFSARTQSNLIHQFYIETELKELLSMHSK